jgi:hypothetical protein
MNVLIAEDDAMTRLMLQCAVEHQGHACLLAQDGLEAWQLFQAHTVDVVISDWLMPHLDGVELCRRVRQQMDASSSWPGYFSKNWRTVPSMTFWSLIVHPPCVQSRLFDCHRITWEQPRWLGVARTAEHLDETVVPDRLRCAEVRVFLCAFPLVDHALIYGHGKEQHAC